jgi:hypothetical protein
MQRNGEIILLKGKSINPRCSEVAPKRWTQIWPPVSFGYCLNAVVSLSLAFGENSWSDFCQGFFVMAVVPALGASLIDIEWRKVQLARLSAFYYFGQLTLLTVVFGVQSFSFSRFGFEGYSKHIAYLSASVLLPWLAYLAALTVFSIFGCCATYCLKRLKSNR